VALDSFSLTRSQSENIKQIVKEKYGHAAQRVIEGKGLPADCCAELSCCDGSAASSCDPTTSNLYGEEQTNQLPEEAVKASLGYGNPTALAKLNPGETILDLSLQDGMRGFLAVLRGTMASQHVTADFHLI
jgi:arsenite methyltransferase